MVVDVICTSVRLVIWQQVVVLTLVEVIDFLVIYNSTLLKVEVT